MDNIDTDNMLDMTSERGSHGGYCRDCRYASFELSYKKFWCGMYEKWTEIDEWHECCSTAFLNFLNARVRR